MVLPSLLDGAPHRRIATRERSRPPDSVHRTLASGSATARARILPAKGDTGALVKVPTAAYFREYIKAEVPLRRIYLLEHFSWWLSAQSVTTVRKPAQSVPLADSIERLSYSFHQSLLRASLDAA